MTLLTIFRKLFHYFNLEPELESYDNIHEEILKGAVFKGTNLWILVFAILVASVGLNMNSTAVIIGAMLISPLMGPINGMGYGIATYNFPLLKKSVKHYTFAVFTSLAASTAYFALSPISTAHSELLARTSPTIYDVLIALFGGLAGVIAISSKNKGNVIPGVAIATALMPPLCTAGYGLATGQFNFFFGAIYLFTINTVFIGIAAIGISQILKFPIRTIIDDDQRKKINKWISVVIMIVLFPSIYFGYGLVMQEKFTENANRYVANVSSFEGNFLLKSDINSNKKIINLIYGGVNLSEKQKQKIIEKSEDFELRGVKINIEQGISFQEFNNTQVDDETLELRNQLNNLSNALQSKNLAYDSITNKVLIGKEILDEIRIIYPNIKSCTYAESFIYADTINSSNSIAIILFGVNNDDEFTDEEKEKILLWTKTRLRKDEIKVIYE